MNRTLSVFAKFAHGQLAGADHAFGAVSSDSRTLAGGDLFVALSGPNFDGHDYVAAAAARGAVGAVVARRLPVDVAQIIVDDPLGALQRAAACWRAGHDIPVVGVAGSNGKTTTKELVASILAERGPCLATKGNLNNHIGVPLTLMRLAPEHRAAVIEIGANVRGDVASLVPWVSPTVGLVTNAGAEHLEGFIDLDGVAAGEGELFEGLPVGAVAIINADDPYASYWRGLAAGARVYTFGMDPSADFHASDVRSSLDADGFRQDFTLVGPSGSADVVLHLGGAHNVMNALCAAAAAFGAGATLEQIRAGLATVRPVKGRLQLKAGTGGAQLIDDSYNANPSSLEAGLGLLSTLPGDKWLVLGDMGELGEGSTEFHVDAGRRARAAGVTRLFAIGSLTGHAVAAFGVGAEWFASAEELCAGVRPLLHPGVTVFIKGSRLNRLERVVDVLQAAPVVAP